jgi:hypothetical protein
MTATPDQLVAQITRALVGGASADERRAGRHACLVLAATLGDAGEPMTWPGTPPSPVTPSAAQLLDLAIAKMRALLDEQDAKARAAAAQTATPAPSSMAGPPRTARPPHPTRPHSLRIPIVSPRRRP